MKRLYMTVEGQTEAAFAMATLQSHLSSFEIYLHPPRFTGPHARRAGRIPRGGMFNTFKHVTADIRRWLKEDKSSDARFSMMVDLYSLPSDFPGYEQGMLLAGAWDQANVLEQALAAELGDDRFMPYLQVHEFEALVLSDPAKLKVLYEGMDRQISHLVAECTHYQSPEEINHGQDAHPKARIHSAVPRYDENVAGPLIAHDIGLQVLRQTCPHFGKWLTELEQLDNGGAP